MKKVNYLGEKSLSVILRYLVNIFWYIQLIIIGLIVIKSVMNSFADENSFSWPVSFVATVQEVTSKNLDIFTSGIKITNGNLMFNTKGHWYANAIMVLGILVMATPSLMITFQVRKILRSFIANEPFLKPNLRRIQFIGIVLLVYPIAAYIFGLFYIHYLNSNFQGYEFVNDVDLWPLFLGLFALVISEVFRLGIQYREDNNLTI